MPASPDTTLLQQLIQRKLTPRAATGNPSIDRAMYQMDKTYSDTKDVDAKPDWGLGMFTNILGHVNPLTPKTIEINALQAAMAPQDVVDDTAAHEIEHTRQFAKDPIPMWAGPETPEAADKYQTKMQAWVDRQNFNLPHDMRKPEQAAEAVAQKFLKKRTPSTHDSINMPIAEGFFDQLAMSPIVQAILKRINNQ